MVTVLYGPAFDGKNEETFGKCLEKIRHNEGDSCLYLVRSDVRVRQLRDLALRECSGCFHFPVLTFPDFIRRMYSACSGAKRVISHLEQKLLIEDILRQRERKRGDRFYLNRFRDHPGILAKVREFIAGVRRAGIASSQELTEKLRECSGKRRQVHEELVTVFERYVARIEVANIIDDTGVFLEIARQAEANQLNIGAWINSPELFVLEGYYELTVPEKKILSALYAQFERSIITFDVPLNPYNFPPEQETPKPFRIFRDLTEYIQTSGFSLREFVGRPTPTPSQERNILLFPPKKEIVPHASPLAKPVPHASPLAKAEMLFKTLGFFDFPEEKFSIKAYRDKKEEVTEIAREVRRLYREGKITALHETGVTFPVIEQYERLIREIFPLFGIPFTMFQGYSLATSPVVVTIFRLLRVVLDGYSREAIANLFSSPLVEFQMTPQTESPLSAGDKLCTSPLVLNSETYLYLDSLARSLGIIGGREQWEEKLTQYQREIEQQIDRRQKGSSAVPTAHCLLNFLSRFETEEARPAEELIDLLIEGIWRFQIPQRILRSEQRHILESEASALRTFFRILDTLKQEFTAYHQRNRHPYTLSLKKFFDEVQLAVREETYYSPETLDDSVFVMGRLDTRQVKFRYVFFGGLVERDFPGQDEPNIFLSDKELETLGLPTARKRSQETDHLFYLNALNPTEHLYLSYPLQEGESDLLRSAYIDKIMQLQTEQEAPSSGVQTLVCPKNLENAFTYTELYQWLGAQLCQREHPPPLPSGGEDTHPSPLPGGELYRRRPRLRELYRTRPRLREVLRFIETEKGRGFVENFLNGLQTQRFRTSNELSPFDGILISDWSKRFLRRRYSRHIYSVSEFDQYVCCPIKFFFQRVIRVRPLQEVLFEIPAVAIGILLHRILYRFYTGTPTGVQTSVCQGNVDTAFLRRRTEKEQWIQEAGSRMYGIVCEELEAYGLAGVFWERFAEMLLAGLSEHGVQDLSGKQGLLATFIELEANTPDKVLPFYLNANFGMPVPPEAVSGQTEVRTPQTKVYTSEEAGYLLSVSPLRIREKDADGKIVTVNVRGQIDRIDLESDPQQEYCRVVIYDYKTGSMPSVQNIKDGLSFQLPLYLLAGQEFLGKDYDVVAGGYYHVRSPHKIGKKGHLGSKEYSEQRYFKGASRSLFETHEEFLRLLEEYKARVVRVAQAISKGRFHPTLLDPHKAGCGYCEYKRICRVDHQRMGDLQ